MAGEGAQSLRGGGEWPARQAGKEEEEIVDMRNDERERREVWEAKEAGSRALESLRAAREKLESAGRWGVWDMIGGGLFSSLIKHSRLDEAQGLMEAAQRDLEVFRRELRDIRIPMEFGVHVGGFLQFADFFFDNFFVDWMVQSQIEEAKEQVEDAIRNVESVLWDLDRYERSLAGGDVE